MPKNINMQEQLLWTREIISRWPRWKQEMANEILRPSPKPLPESLCKKHRS